ncbi:MAG TPA: PIN domain-containing protein [Streptosporangiaceae bacterium]
MSGDVAPQKSPPYILDLSVLIAIARGDTDIMALIQGYDAGRQPLVVPALTAAGAALDARSDDADDLLAGVELLEAVTVAPLRDTEQATRLAAIIARTGLDPWDAHAAAVADASACPVITLDAAKWQQPSLELDRPLDIIEIADPGD